MVRRAGLEDGIASNSPHERRGIPVSKIAGALRDAHHRPHSSSIEAACSYGAVGADRWIDD
jgi:hypothetical protein